MLFGIFFRYERMLLRNLFCEKTTDVVTFGSPLLDQECLWMNVFTYMIFLVTFAFIFPLFPQMYLEPNSIGNTDCCYLPNNLIFLKISKDVTTWILKLCLIQLTIKVNWEGSKLNFPSLEDIKTVERCWIRSVNHTLPWRLWWSSKYD